MSLGNISRLKQNAYNNKSKACHEEVPTTYSPTIKILGPSSDVPPLDITHLQEEANKALGDWLAIKPSIEACQWKLVSEFI